MNFVLQTPSLQHAAGVKIVTCLWNQPDIFTQIAESFNNLPAVNLNAYNKEWQEMEEKVKSKVPVLSLPEECKKELLKFIKPIGMEIVHWCHYHHLDGYSFKILGTLQHRQFRWGMHGTIDYAKMAESMVKDERLSVERRFEFACLNCLEDEARQLIGLVTYDRKHEYHLWMMDHRILIAYFACTLSGDLDRLNRLYQAMFLRAGSLNKHLFKVVLSDGSRATCEYFFRKLSPADKEQLYMTLPFRPTPSPTCGLMYVLSLLIKEQMFQGSKSILYLLRLLLRWPMQPLFMEAAKRGWQLMDGNDHADVLGKVIYKIKNGFEDCDYIQWFKELWRSSPAEHQHHYLSYISRLVDLISTKRIGFIQLVFNEAPSHLLERLVQETHIYDRIGGVLMDENVICDAALMECKQTALLSSSNDEEKRLRSQHVGRLVDLVMESRMKSREKAELTTS